LLARRPHRQWPGFGWLGKMIEEIFLVALLGSADEWEDRMESLPW
jgi:hypothetical protein